MLVRKTSAESSTEGECAFCGCQEGRDNPFPDVKMVGEEIQKFMTGCSYHMAGFIKGQWWRDYTWATLCAELPNDQDASDAFEECCMVVSGSRSSASSAHDVALRSRQGSIVYRDCVLLTEADYKNDIAPEGGKSITSAQVGERVTELTNEYGEKVSGVLALDPSSPYLKVRVFSSAFSDHAEWAMAAEDCVREALGQRVQESAAKFVRDSLPTGLRGHVSIPSVGELRTKAFGAAKALGLITVATREPGTASRQQLEIADREQPIPMTPGCFSQVASPASKGDSTSAQRLHPDPPGDDVEDFVGDDSPKTVKSGFSGGTDIQRAPIPRHPSVSSFTEVAMEMAQQK